MENTISHDSGNSDLNVRKFTGRMENPADVKDIGQDLEVTSNDTIAGMGIDAGAVYDYDYELLVIRKKRTV